MATTTKELQSQLDYIKYSRDEIHSYSKAVGRLFDLAISYVYDAEEACERGRSAVWTWGLWEAPLLYACDVIPISFTELGRLGSLDTITVAEDYYQVPRESCSMVKATLGEWYLRKNKGIKRILGFNALCEPYNLALELMRKEGYDVHDIETVYLPLNCDAARYNELINFLVAELNEVVQWLTGDKVDESKLLSEIKWRNQLIRKVRRILELRIRHPLYIRSLPTMFLLMGSGHYFGKPKEYMDVVDLLLEELENAGDSDLQKNVVPLVWAGGRGQEFGVYKAIDDSGGAILGWVIPTPIETDYREDIPPVESLARYLLGERLQVGSAIYWRDPIDEEIKKTKAKGIVFYGYVGCSYGGIQQELDREYFHKQEIPSIALEGSFQVGPPSGQLLTRIRAFIEMLS